MGRASMRLHGSGEPLAVARDRFLAAEPVDRGVVREPILASWWRSRSSNVAADRLEATYQRDPDLDCSLARSASPVLRRLHEQLDGQPISVILTDAAGLVLCRFTGDRDLERQLDRIALAPGFSYAEDIVGTNGIGTALEAGGPAHVFGHEHYAERLEGMACAGAPIRDPVSGKTVGVVDLTCWRTDADPLLISLAQATAHQVNQALGAQSCDRDQILLREYLRACRHSGGIVLALGSDIVMLNDNARQALSPADQAALIARATDALAQRDTQAITADLPSGMVVRVSCRRVSGDAPVCDGVVNVKIVADAVSALVESPAGLVPPPVTAPEAMPARVPGTRPAGALSGASQRDQPSREYQQARAAQPTRGPMALPTRGPMALPGLAGSGPAWRRACRDAETSYDSGEWLTLEGERGAGKLALIRAVHQRRSPASPFHVVDAAAPEFVARLRAELPGGGGMIVIRHAEAIVARDVRSLASLLQEASRSAASDAGRPGSSGGGSSGGAGRPGSSGADRCEHGSGVRVAVTLDRARVRTDLTGVLRFFPAAIEVPPLRHHVEDLHDLVPFFLARLSQQGRLSVSPAAMQLLLRHVWPGNVSQLWDVLKQVVQRRRAGVIMPQDLPPECWTVSRRVLSPLESMERDEIVRSLLDHGGNKIRAARALGMSRATIYRRIHDYGIVTTPPG